jgi:protocatechuate 3,4-dioxygenase beta subunit
MRCRWHVGLGALLSLVLLAPPVGAGPTAGLAVATVPGGAELAGRVTAADSGSPLRGVCVAAESNGGLYRTTSDADGRWRLADLPAGAMFVSFNECEAAVPGYAAVWWPDGASLDAAHGVSVALGEQGRLDVGLLAAAVVTGRVVDRDGVTVRGACVAAVDDAGATIGRTRTDSAGHYELTALPPGEYEVEARDCTTPAVLTAATASVLAQRGAAATVDLTMGLGGAIEGLVTAEHTGAPVAGACVTLWTAETIVGAGLYRGHVITGLDPLAATTPERGTFVFDGVAPGSYRVFFGFDFCSPEDSYAEEWFDDVHGPDMYDQDVVTAVLDVTAGTVISGIDASLLPVPTTKQVCPWPPPAPFNDIGSDAVHAEGIACAYALGVARGQIDGSFRPGVRVTRAQFASLLVRAMTVAGAASLDGPVPDAFSDDDDSPHEPAINELAARGVLTGVGERRAAPGDWVTRGQMATTLVRAYGVVTGGQLRRGPDRWTDDDASVHEPGLDALGLAGVLGGTTPTQVSPGRAVRRDAAATAVARLIDRTLRDR